MKTIHLVFLPLLAALFLLPCCQDYSSPYTDVEFEAQARGFDGTIYDYLLQGDADLGVRFDSMIVLIQGIEGRQELLSDPDAELTFFAVSNESFQATLQTFNRVREVRQKSAIYMNDLLIEPFMVIIPIDTAYLRNAEGSLIYDDDGRRMVDSVRYSRTRYDYRKQADTLLCRYIFQGIYDFDAVAGNFRGIEPQSIVYNIRMHIQSERQASSGITNSGAKRLVFSDMGNSKLTTDWLRSHTRQIDIRARNGVIHVLATGHEFGFNGFFNMFSDYFIIEDDDEEDDDE